MATTQDELSELSTAAKRIVSRTADLAKQTRSLPVWEAVSEVSAAPESAREIVAAVLKHSEHGHAALTERLESSDAYLSQFIFLPELVLQVVRLREEALTLVGDSDRLVAQLQDSEEITAVLKHYVSSTRARYRLCASGDFYEDDSWSSAIEAATGLPNHLPWVTSLRWKSLLRGGTPDPQTFLDICWESQKTIWRFSLLPDAVEEIHDRISYEITWLRHVLCGFPEPVRHDLKRDFWLTERPERPPLWMWLLTPLFWLQNRLLLAFFRPAGNLEWDATDENNPADVSPDVQEFVKTVSTPRLSLITADQEESPLNVEADTPDERQDPVSMVWSQFRTPSEWRQLRDSVGLPSSERTWTGLRKRHPKEIAGEPGNEAKSCRITQTLAHSWGLSLPEFEESAG